MRIIALVWCVVGCSSAVADESTSASGSSITWGEEVIDCAASFPVDVPIPDGSMWQVEHEDAQRESVTDGRIIRDGVLRLGGCPVEGVGVMVVRWVEFG